MAFAVRGEDVLKKSVLLTAPDIWLPLIRESGNCRLFLKMGLSN